MDTVKNVNGIKIAKKSFVPILSIKSNLKIRMIVPIVKISPTTVDSPRNKSGDCNFITDFNSTTNHRILGIRRIKNRI
jgi:hypothetical protein